MKNDKMLTVAEGLGINEEWSILNKYRTLQWINESLEMSDAIIKSISSVKTDEFGEVDNKISEYERKLVITGMHLGEHAITKVLTSWGNAMANYGEELT